MTEPKPCPAGHPHVEAKRYYVVPDKIIGYAYHCLFCGWSGPWALTQEEARDKWNTRLDPPEEPLPCMWCGKKAEVHNTYVCCSDYGCGAEGPIRPTSAEASAAWNEVARKVKP